MQKWSQTSPKSILALHSMKKWAKNINMTFWYLPRSMDTKFWGVYEPYRALQGLQGVGFQGKNCLTKVASSAVQCYHLYVFWKSPTCFQITLMRLTNNQCVCDKYSLFSGYFHIVFFVSLLTNLLSYSSIYLFYQTQYKKQFDWQKSTKSCTFATLFVSCFYSVLLRFSVVSTSISRVKFI